MNKNVVAVCVTFNRLDKLKNTINAFDSQTVPITELVVVDNASTDSTKEFLSTWVKQIGKYRKKVRFWWVLRRNGICRHCSRL